MTRDEELHEAVARFEAAVHRMEVLIKELAAVTELVGLLTLTIRRLNTQPDFDFRTGQRPE